MPIWEALYYELPIGGAAPSVPGNFRRVNWSAKFQIPPHWVLVATVSGDANAGGHPSMRLGTGAFVDHWKILSKLNGWVDYGGAFAPAGYRISADRKVTVRGLVKSGTVNTSIGTLPVGYRPGYSLIFVQLQNSEVIVRINVTADGNITQYANGTNGYVSLSGISFYVDG